MALPKLNNATYELTLPSTGEQVKYRPFLVKEQKALMIAQESEDDKQIENTLAQILSDCVLEDIDPYKMPVFDVEYLFLRIRGKSVGEKVVLNVLCPDDEKTRVDVEINLESLAFTIFASHRLHINLPSLNWNPPLVILLDIILEHVLQKKPFFIIKIAGIINIKKIKFIIIDT